MANKFQKFLFNLSTMSPMVSILAAVYWIEQDVPFLFVEEAGEFRIHSQSMALLALILTGIVFSLYSFLFVKTCVHRLERIPISIDSVSCNDNWVIAVLLAYAMPAASFVFEGSNVYVTGFLVVLMLLFLLFSNSVFPNPLLLLGKFHFYKVVNVNGGGELCLLSKRSSIVNKDSVSEIVCAFDYLAIEEI